MRVTGDADTVSAEAPEVSVPATPWARHQSLNTPDIGGSGKVRPAEEAAAAQLEPVVGKMERYVGPRGANNKSPDFVIVEGPNQGKTADMMFTTVDGGAKEVEGLNRLFEKNMTASHAGRSLPPLVKQVQEHLLKADILVLDLRFLIPQNTRMLTNYLSTLPTEQRRRLVLILQENCTMAGCIYFGTDKSIKVGDNTNEGYVSTSTFVAFGELMDAALRGLDPAILASIKEPEPLMMYELRDLDADEYNLVIRTMRQHVAAVVQPSASEEAAIWVWNEMAEPFIRKDARYDFAYHGEQEPAEPSE